MRTILDISHHNTITDWNLIKEKVDAVVIRMGFRRYASGAIEYDRKYEEHKRACEEHGIPYTIYFFPCAISEDEAREEAEFTIREALRMPGFCLPVFADSEIADVKQGKGRADNLTVEQRTRFLQVFCDTLQNAGIPAGIYASKAWMENNVDRTRLPYTIWIAQWAERCTYGGQYLMWQYTSKGQLQGAAGAVDLSVCYDQVQNLPAATYAEDKAVTGKTTARTLFVETARQMIGIKEGSPAHIEMIEVYNGHEPRARGYKAKATDSWCALFVSAMAIICRLTDRIVTEVSCGQMIERYKDRGQWIEDDNFVPAPGDLIFYDWQDGADHTGDNTGWPDHVGIVQEVGGGFITAIEGNINDQVGTRRIPIGGRFIRGFAAPLPHEDAPAIIQQPEETSQPEPEPVDDYTGPRRISVAILNIREEPDKNSRDLGDLMRGSVVRVDRTQDGWGHIEGWIKLEHTKKG